METATDKVPNTSATAASAASDLNGMAIMVRKNDLFSFNLLPTFFAYFFYSFTLIQNFDIMIIYYSLLIIYIRTCFLLLFLT